MKESKENHTQKLSHCFNFLFRIDLLFKLRNREYWLVSPLIILKSTGTDRKSVHQANKWNTHDTYSYIFTCITFLMTKGCHNVNVNCRNVLLVFVSIFFGKPISSFVYRAFELEKKHMSKQMMLCSGQI